MVHFADLRGYARCGPVVHRATIISLFIVKLKFCFTKSIEAYFNVILGNYRLHYTQGLVYVMCYTVQATANKNKIL